MATHIDPSARRRETTELTGFQNSMGYSAEGKKKEYNPAQSERQPNDESA
jgi:hypothetical protein